MFYDENTSDQKLNYSQLSENFSSSHKILIQYRSLFAKIPLSFLSYIGQTASTSTCFMVHDRFTYSEEPDEIIETEFGSNVSLKINLYLSFNGRSYGGKFVEYARPVIIYRLDLNPSHLRAPFLKIEAFGHTIVETNELQIDSDDLFIKNLTKETYKFIRSNSNLMICRKREIKEHDPFGLNLV